MAPLPYRIFHWRNKMDHGLNQNASSSRKVMIGVLIDVIKPALKMIIEID